MVSLFTQSALRASLQTAVRVQKFQACYKLTRIHLLPAVTVPLCRKNKGIHSSK
jgi:hypothetical protein